MAIGSTPARSTTSRRNSETKNAASMLRMHGCDMHTSITGRRPTRSLSAPQRGAVHSWPATYAPATQPA